jgi:hypothetical protein
MTTQASRRGPRRWLARGVAAAVIAAGSVIAIATPAQAAISSVRIVEEIFDVQSYSTGTEAVFCNTNEKVLGGGALVMSLNSSVKLLESYAFKDHQWRVRLYNPTSTWQEVRVRAICATGVDGYERKMTTDGVAPNTTKDITSACPAGKTSIAGGFGIYDTYLAKASASYAYGTGWKVQIRNDDPYKHPAINVQAICTSQTGRSYAWITVTVNAGSTNVYTGNCGSNKWLVGGGWVTNESTPYNIVTASIPTDATNDYWKINLSNPDSVAHTVQYMHLCLPK